MSQWRRVSLLLLLFAPLAASHSLGYPIKVNFTVLGDPADPVNAGLTGNGYFMFDSSVMLLGLRPQAIRAISFSWEGRNWTQADADMNNVSFAPDSTVTGWSLGGDAATAGNLSSTEQDFIVGLAGSFLYFYYTTASGTSYYSGTVVTWDAARLPAMLAAWSEGSVEFALDSFGRVYSYAQVGCPGQLGSVSIMGNLFGGAPPSPVINVENHSNIVFATLENGDLWQLCSGATVGSLVGNIFQVPGIAAVAVNVPRATNSMALPRPNPFNPDTQLPYTLASPGRVTIHVFDASGRLVRTLEDARRPAGSFVARWDGKMDGGTAAASGIYFGRIMFPDGSHSERKLTIVR